jgi:hypothetical protein
MVLLLILLSLIIILPYLLRLSEHDASLHGKQTHMCTCEEQGSSGRSANMFATQNVAESAPQHRMPCRRSNCGISHHKLNLTIPRLLRVQANLGSALIQREHGTWVATDRGTTAGREAGPAALTMMRRFGVALGYLTVH